MPEKPTSEDQNSDSPQEEDIVYTPDFAFFPKGRHIYRQEGPYLVCRGCELHHAIHIGMDKLMVGEDGEGNPILKSRKEVFAD